MVLRSEQETMQALIRDAITLLCKSNLQFKNCISMEALVGITLDEKDIILVSMKETIRQTTSPKKTPMQVALKSVQAAVERVNAKTGGKKSPKKRHSPKGKKSPSPRVINIMPTNLPEAQNTPVAIGTIETGGDCHNDISIEFLKAGPKEEDVVVKKEKESEDGYGGTVPELLVPGPVIQAETVLQDMVGTPQAFILDGATQSPNLSPTKKKARAISKRKIPEKNDGGQKVPRMFIPDGRPPVPLDVRYLGFNRTILEDKDFKRGKFLDKLAEGEIKWDQLNEHQQNCVFAKAALRGREENEIVCSLCFLAFTKAQEYKKHVRSHFGQFSIPCSICGHECWSLDHLEVHMATHVTFQCPLCNETYPSKLALTTHIRTDHRIFCQDPSNSAEESPEAKEVTSPEADKPITDKQSSSMVTNVDNADTGKPKPAKATGSVKTPVIRKETPKKNENVKTSEGKVNTKANTMQVTVVPQLIGTGSADGRSQDDSDSEQEQELEPKPDSSQTKAPLTRSRGKVSKAKGPNAK